ncbi:MAG: enoyl-CoA hydratase/isomerase family protein [Novosphingobium sp.]|nr:enoyl-CoA hydratase/isomerase family protein [Novosphingobium sp.]
MTATPLDVSGVRFSIDGAIATITLDRPKAGNTIDMDMADGLAAASLRCVGDDTIRCVVVTGEGRFFCGGGDLAAMKAAGDANRGAFLHDLADRVHIALSRLMRMPKPLITIVNGPAAGAGLSLAICGDIVLAARSATFLAAYGGVGLTPDGGMSWSLPRLVGMRRAQEIIIRNRPVDAEEAGRIGLVTEVIDDDALLAEGMKLAQELAGGATAAIGSARALLLAAYDNALEAQLALEARTISAAGMTHEAAEGIGAFLEKRRPDFAGAARKSVTKKEA